MRQHERCSSMCVPLRPSARLQTSRLADRTLSFVHVSHSPYGQYDVSLAYRFSSAPLVLPL